MKLWMIKTLASIFVLVLLFSIVIVLCIYAERPLMLIGIGAIAYLAIMLLEGIRDAK